MSFDLLDHLKNGSDIDSEGYSIRPDSAIDMRLKAKNLNSNGEPFKNKDNDDMNNLYGVSSSDSDSDDSDSENGDGSGGPLKVMVKIKNKDEVGEKPSNNADVLREISKNLQLKPPGQQNTLKMQPKKRTYYYNYGTANPDQAPSGWLNNSNNSDAKSPPTEQGNTNMHRSVSVGSVASTNKFSLFDDLKLELSKPDAGKIR